MIFPVGLARRLPALVLASAVPCISGCVTDGPPGEPGAVATWDFEGAPAAAARLWPEEGSGPRRTRHHLRSESVDDELIAFVEKKDPYFTWQLPSPMRASLVRVDVESDRPGRLQVFWTSTECPVFSEPCSLSKQLRAGRQVVAFFLRVQDLRELRLDLPEEIGCKVVLRGLSLGVGAALDVPWEAGAPGIELTLTPLGLTLRSSVPDPWMSIATPGLHAEQVTAVEATVRGPGGPPQLYWEGPGAPFGEERSARLSPVDAGALTHRAVLSGIPTWKGEVRLLRFDPGPGAGDYGIEYVGLVRE